MLALAVLAVFATPSAAHADDSLAVQIVDAMNKIYGSHPGFRANHAKGIVVEGTFEPAPEAAKLSVSPLFSSGKVPVTVRFSDAGGLPTVPDGSTRSQPARDGREVPSPERGHRHGDELAQDLSGGDRRGLPRPEPGHRRKPAGAAKPTALETFIASHPSVPKALGAVGTPASFADEEYHGVNAFVFTNKAGQKQAVRYVLRPRKSST